MHKTFDMTSLWIHKPHNVIKVGVIEPSGAQTVPFDLTDQEKGLLAAPPHLQQMTG